VSSLVSARAYPAVVDTKPPGKSKGRELAERITEAGLSSVPLAGGTLAVVFTTLVSWRLDQHREEWLTELAEAVEDLQRRLGDVDVDKLVEDPRFLDAVVSATRTIEHTHQRDKVEALRNAVLNSVSPDAPDADTQAYFLNLADRFTASHLRLLTMWDDPPAWFEARGLTAPVTMFAGSRTMTVDIGLPEMKGRQEFYLALAEDLRVAGLLSAQLTGNVSGSALMSRLTTEMGRQMVRFISAPSDR